MVTLVRPKHLALQDPQIEMSVTTTEEGTIAAVTLEAKKPALWVWLEAEDEDMAYRIREALAAQSGVTEMNMFGWPSWATAICAADWKKGSGPQLATSEV